MDESEETKQIAARIAEQEKELAEYQTEYKNIPPIEFREQLERMRKQLEAKARRDEHIIELGREHLKKKIRENITNVFNRQQPECIVRRRLDEAVIEGITEYIEKVQYPMDLSRSDEVLYHLYCFIAKSRGIIL